MSGKSPIQWTDASWNPVVGCKRVSAGCDHCDCPHGQNGKSGCVHEMAARRFVANRRAAYERLADPLVQAQMADEQAQRDSSVRRSNAFSFWR